jgi:hypothetical protein
MTEIVCVSCDSALSEGEDHHQQDGDTYCEECWYDEGDGVYFCEGCDTRLLLNDDFIVWQDTENYTEPLCEECASAEKDPA